jgi:hypothetical protein
VSKESLSSPTMLPSKCKESTSMESPFGLFIVKMMALLNATNTCKAGMRTKMSRPCVKAFLETLSPTQNLMMSSKSVISWKTPCASN